MHLLRILIYGKCFLRYMKYKYVNKDGCFKKIKKIEGKAVKDILKETDPETGRQKPTKVFKKEMANYFSIGIDARIGLGLYLIIKVSIKTERNQDVLIRLYIFGKD